jgi:hypothetical protein
MNHDEHPNDSTLTRELRDALSEVTAPGPPPLAAITNRGRAHQRRRLAGLASLGVTGVAAGTALALSLTGVLGAVPDHSTAAIRTAAPARSTGTIRTAAFTLTSNANGTDTLTLTRGQVLDPAALQQALAQDDIPALVKTDDDCSSTPEPVARGVLTLELANGAPVTSVPVNGTSGSKPSPGVNKVIPADTMTVVNPAAMPSGTELFFGYFDSDHVLTAHLIDSSSYTCSTGTQPPVIR